MPSLTRIYITRRLAGYWEGQDLLTTCWVTAERAGNENAVSLLALWWQSGIEELKAWAVSVPNEARRRGLALSPVNATESDLDPRGA